MKVAAFSFRRLLVVTVVATCALFITTTLSYSQYFRIEKILMCSNNLRSIESPCTEVSAPYDKLDKKAFSNNRLDAKVWIACDKESLSFLEANNNVLPVNVAVWVNGTRLKTDIDIGIRQDHWDRDGEALRSLYLENGSFPWRTRFHLPLGRAHTISIEINDAQDNLVFIGKEPARFRFSFRN